jgi:PBP1b-binding outer membrane lipoprotein LpoB
MARSSWAATASASAVSALAVIAVIGCLLSGCSQEGKTNFKDGEKFTAASPPQNVIEEAQRKQRESANRTQSAVPR